MSGQPKTAGLDRKLAELVDTHGLDAVLACLIDLAGVRSQHAHMAQDYWRRALLGLKATEQQLSTSNPESCSHEDLDQLGRAGGTGVL